MSRNIPANGSDAKRRKQAEDTTISGVRTGYKGEAECATLFRPTLAERHVRASRY
jgi:hypothetical protein